MNELHYTKLCIILGLHKFGSNSTPPPSLIFFQNKMCDQSSFDNSNKIIQNNYEETPSSPQPPPPPPPPPPMWTPTAMIPRLGEMLDYLQTIESFAQQMIQSEKCSDFNCNHKFDDNDDDGDDDYDDIAPPPPPAPMWTPQMLALRQDDILKRIKRLEQFVKNPLIISIHGVQHLHPKQTFLRPKWEIRLHTLFFETKLSWAWIIKSVPDNVNPDNNFYANNIDNDDDDEDPNIVHLYVANHAYQDKIKNVLQHYLKLQYDDSVYIQ